MDRKPPSRTAEVGVWVAFVNAEGDVASLQCLGKQDAGDACADDEDVGLLLHWNRSELMWNIVHEIPSDVFTLANARDAGSVIKQQARRRGTERSMDGGSG